MEAKLIEIAAKIGTPLALAGLTVAVLFLVYRAIIKSGLLSTVHASHTFKILNRVLTYVFVLALVAIALGVASYLVPSVVERPRKVSELEVTDLAVVKRPSFPVLDLKFRNVGRDVAYIKKVSIEVLEKKVKPEESHFYAGPSTWEYNVLIDPRSDQRVYELATSQIVPSNGTERFSIVIGQQSGYADIDYTDYRLRLRVHYNANEVIETKEVNVRVVSPPHFLAPLQPVGPTTEERLAALGSPNPKIVEEIATVVGAVGNRDALPKLLAVLAQPAEHYLSYYKEHVLTQPFHRERGLPAPAALEHMYASVLWAVKQLAGEFPMAALDRMAPDARAFADKALEQVKRRESGR
jgi:hypothetical protein